MVQPLVPQVPTELKVPRMFSKAELIVTTAVIAIVASVVTGIAVYKFFREEPTVVPDPKTTVGLELTNGEQWHCEDSDASVANADDKSVYTKGSITYTDLRDINSEMKAVTQEDLCSSAGQVFEQTCDAPPFRSGAVAPFNTGKSVICSNGCFDGVCLKAKGDLPGTIQKFFSEPYPVTWNENNGNNTFSLTGVSIGWVPSILYVPSYNDKSVYAVVLHLKVSVGKNATSVPMTLRIVKDGNNVLPDTKQFTFSSGGTYSPAYATYENQEVFFVVSETQKSFRFTSTAQGSPLLFEVTLGDNGEITVKDLLKK